MEIIAHNAGVSHRSQCNSLSVACCLTWLPSCCMQILFVDYTLNRLSEFTKTKLTVAVKLDWLKCTCFLVAYFPLFGQFYFLPLTYAFCHSQVNLPTLRGLKLIRLRNPHGDSSEWVGAWSDGWQSLLINFQNKRGRANAVESPFSL